MGENTRDDVGRDRRPNEDRLTYGEVRALIAQEELGWQPPADIPDYVQVPLRPTGASKQGLVAAEQVAEINFQALDLTANAHLAVRRVQRHLADPDLVRAAYPSNLLRRLGLDDVTLTGIQEPGDAGAPAALDWRNRWGRNWITTTRDQQSCNACWAFAGVALIESMVTIEHAMWTRLSEGDPHRGVGKVCADLGNLGEVSNFFNANGVCDPGSWPWQTANPTYAPTPDRNGRSVRGPKFTVVSPANSKDWLDTVGPLVSWIDVYNDFSAVGSTVYRRSTDPANAFRGGHFVLIIGYSDALGAWLVKNSWGTGWGMNGIGWIAYGECNMETYGRYGLKNTNPDPWTKRRLHNGNLYESGNGALHRNLEVVGARGSRVLHRWRHGGPPWTWGSARSFGNDAAQSPTLTGTTFNRNMEVVYTTTGGRLHHWWVDGGASGPWNDGGVFGPTGIVGPPGFAQGDYGAPGNLEVVVATGGRLQHVWRGGSGWRNGPVFGTGIARGGATLVQGSYGSPHGNLEYVAVRADRTMQHFWRDEPTFTWRAGAIFGSNVRTSPVMIQGQYGMQNEGGPHGNFELCVAVDGRVQHWWRWNSAGSDMGWRHSATFGNNVAAVTGLAQSSWGMNLEVIVLRTDGQLQHYWRDSAGWHVGPVLGPA